eukprot:CAMPEP_0179448294 /NCGR_PEP_ID=MMETSP0799-20121207/32156_1 /TAXON_ID=46947 /ORGANISM="Geminigera cryophila, Strain CCMP2564" /LENGTH=56 /DNA_ID=CAMNT_0021240025 /DNA_START=47 /DNA_END=217 /DNA_ORIENTATION=-
MVHNAYGAAAVKSANTLDEEVKSIMGNSKNKTLGTEQGVTPDRSIMTHYSAGGMLA